MRTLSVNELVAFEDRVAELWEGGKLPFLVHLCGGNEEQLTHLFRSIRSHDWVLSTHRNHYHYLLKGGSPERLMQLITGGRSMFVFDSTIRFMSSAILGGLCGVAAGLALGLKQRESQSRVWCFVGDGAEDNGHIYEAVKMVASLDLPVKFVIEDNDRSCGVTRAQRGASWTFPWPERYVTRYRYVSRFPHAGNGTTKKIVFDEAIVKRFQP